MRRSLVRAVSLLFPVSILLALGLLAALQWQRSGALQHARDASIATGGEARLLALLEAGLSDAERTQHAYLSSGNRIDLGAFQHATHRLAAMSDRLRTRAAAEVAADPGLPALIEGVLGRQAVLDRTAALRQSGAIGGQQALRGVADTDHVLERVSRAARALEGSHQSDLRTVTGGIRALRWIALGVAGMGAVGVLGIARQLRRAWRRLARAESEQRLLAHQLRASLDSLSQGVAVFSAGGLLLNWNMRLRQILDLPEPLLRCGLPYEALARQLVFAGDDFLEPLRAIRAGTPDPALSRPMVYERTVARAGEGTQIEIRRTLMPQGGFVLTLTDMTERAQAEQMLRQAQKMQAVGQLTGGIAHDFNNMLTVILSSLDVSDDELAAARAGQAAWLRTRMQRAARAAESGAALTRQLLDFARNQPLAPAPVDLAQILPNLMPLLRHTIGETIALSFRHPAQLWPATASCAQLESAVLNLALNARDAMPSGGTLVIDAANCHAGNFDTDGASLPRELAPGDYVRISVADSGRGMSRETVARAFEPFFTTKSEGGTGLGLAMVFAFARQCGGLATIQSELGRGSTIRLYLPRALAAPVASPPAVVPAAPLAVLEGAGRPRIMVVEDDQAVREIAAAVLRELGYRVSEAQDAEEAIRKLDDQLAPLDLLLTDLTLPGSMDGQGLAARVRQSSPATRILYMSGHRECPQAPGPEAGEAVRWLSKPFRRHQLAAAVDALVSQSPTGQAA